MQMQLRNIIYGVIVLVMLLGLVVAAANLPVLTHCQFYGECTPATTNSADRQTIGTEPAGLQ